MPTKSYRRFRRFGRSVSRGRAPTTDSHSRNFKELLKSKDMTQQELADELAVHQTLISQWCNGKGAPDIEKAVKISRILNVDIKEVIKCFSKD